MQLGGIGNKHNATMHQVTHCIHDHSHAPNSGASAGAAAQSNLQTLQPQTDQNIQFSLSSWLDKTLGSGKRLLKNIWGDHQNTNSSETNGNSLNPQIMAQIYADNSQDKQGNNSSGRNHQQPELSPPLHTPQIAAAATAIAAPEAQHQGSYYAAAEEIGMGRETIWQKVRVKFKDIASQLTGHLPGNVFNFQAKSSFQAKQEQPKEDLRKEPKLQRDHVDINSHLTEDNYLLDSYDRNGAYSKLSAKK